MDKSLWMCAERVGRRGEGGGARQGTRVVLGTKSCKGKSYKTNGLRETRLIF